MVELASSTVPYAVTRAESFATRLPSPSPVVPSSPAPVSIFDRRLPMAGGQCVFRLRATGWACAAPCSLSTSAIAATATHSPAARHYGTNQPHSVFAHAAHLQLENGRVWDQ